MRLSVRTKFTIAVFFVLTLLTTAAFAVPQTINYQGYLEDSGGIPVNGTVNMDFAIYDAPTGGALLWSETQSGVTVTEGAFSVALGIANAIDLPFDAQYYLGVDVNGDGEMTPRAVLVSVPYAFTAAKADDADLLDGQHSSEIIDAASDEVRTPISSVPFTISTPGSYYLTGDMNVTGTSDTGITVNASNVTIDLMGFMINGPGSGTGKGIYMNGRQNVEVRNGTVRGFGNTGISEASAAAGRGHRVINMRVEDNGSTGIYLQGNEGGHIVKDSQSLGNGGFGILVSNGSTVSGSVAANNFTYGIGTASGCTVTGNTAYQNGTVGIDVLAGSVVTENAAYKNGNTGIHATTGCAVEGNVANDNGSHGIWVGTGTTVKNNTAYWNQNYGIQLDGDNLVDGNTAVNNNKSGSSYTNFEECLSCVITGSNLPLP
jgi:parallel beta-helix repeat protein